MSTSVDQIGERLRIARESRGITQSKVAAEMRLNSSAISLMEAGKRQVSTLELTRLAKLYGRSIEWFVSTEPKPESPIFALFRAEPSLKSAAVEEQAGYCLRLFSVGASLAAMLGRTSMNVVPCYELPEPRSTGLAIVQGQSVANQERRRLGLGVAPVRSISRLIGAQGIWTAALKLSDEVSGFFVRNLEFGMGILINKGQASVRKRFSYAHEYGHALMDRDRAATATSRHNAKHAREQRANAFAAAFLMPEDGVWAFVHQLGKGLGSRHEGAVVDSVEEQAMRGEVRMPSGSQRVTYTDVALLSRNFGVSYVAAVWRLRGLNIISAKEVEVLQDQADMAKNYLKAVQADEPPTKESGGALAENHEDYDLKRQILPLALEAWRRGEISQDRLLEISRDLHVDDAVTLDLAEAAALS